MSQTEFQTLATHLAGKDVEIEFDTKSNAVPSTNGKKIILPVRVNRKCIYPTIAATLHESHHCKLSDFDAIIQLSTDFRDHYYKKGGTLQLSTRIFSLMLNLLEDIRIDNVVFKEFCNSRELYRYLITEIERKKEEIVPGEDMDAKALIFRLMEYVYLKGVGFEDTYIWDENIKKFCENKGVSAKIDEIIKGSIDAVTIKGLLNPGKKFVELITSIVENENFKKELEKQKKEKEAALQKQLDDARSSSKKSEDKLNDVRKDCESLRKKYDKASKEVYDKLDGDEDEIKEKRKERVEKKDELGKKLNEAWEKETKARRDFNKDSDEVSQISNELQTAKQPIETMIERELSEGCHGNGVVSFKNLVNNFKLNKREDVPMFSSNIETIFSRLANKVDKSESSGKINVKNIYKIFDSNGTSIDDIFTHNHRKRGYNNKLVIMMDVSGSMRGARENVMFKVVGNLLRVIDANKETYNIDYAVMLYSGRVEFLKKFEEEKIMNHDNLCGQVWNEGKLMHGGTEILLAMKTAQEYLDNEADLKDNKYMIVFTDADFNENDNKVILNKYNAEREKIIFIGIGDKKRFTKDNFKYDKNLEKFYKQILMGRMVNNTPSMEKVLLEGFDRIIGN